RRVARGDIVTSLTLEPYLDPVDALAGVTEQWIPQNRGPRGRWERRAADCDARPAICEWSRGVRLNHAPRGIGTYSRTLRDATGSNAEGRDSDSRKGSYDANPQPRRVVRHERAEEEPRTLESPDRARQGDKDSEHDEDDSHGERTRGGRIRLGLMSSRRVRRPAPLSSASSRHPPVVSSASCACQLRYRSSISYGGAWQDRYRRRALPTFRIPCVDPGGKYT